MMPDDDDLDAEERRILSQGYGELRPPPLKSEFIQGALSVRLPGAFASVGAPRVVVDSSGLGWARWGKLSVGALAMGALGFALGVGASRASTGTASTAQRSLDPVPTSEAPGEAFAVPLSELEVLHDVQERASGRKAQPASGARPADEQAKKAQGSGGAEVSFYEELSYIRRAQTALAAGNPTLALGLMQSLRELRSDGALLAERGMTEVLALCALGRPDEAREVSARVRARSDGSMYVTRLAKTCAREDSSEDSASQPTSTEQSPRRP